MIGAGGGGHYRYSAVPPGKRSFYEQHPEAIYANWLRGLGLGTGGQEALRHRMDDSYSRYLYRLVTDPRFSGNFGDFLADLSPRSELARYAPRMRGLNPQQFAQRGRWVTY